jgi:hypothetical protein
MKIRFTLVQDDLERLTLDGPIEFDPRVMYVDEVEDLQDQAGIAPGDWYQQLRDWLGGMYRLAELDPAAQRLAIRTERAAVWIAVGRTLGSRPPFSTLTYQRNALRVAAVDPEPAGGDAEGKAPDA